MLKVVLFLVLYNAQTGEPLQGRSHTFENLTQCEAVLKEARAAKPGNGLAVDGFCFIPGLTGT
jgi:hypothetical protein